MLHQGGCPSFNTISSFLGPFPHSRNQSGACRHDISCSTQTVLQHNHKETCFSSGSWRQSEVGATPQAPVSGVAETESTLVAWATADEGPVTTLHTPQLLTANMTEAEIRTAYALMACFSPATQEVTEGCSIACERLAGAAGGMRLPWSFALLMPFRCMTLVTYLLWTVLLQGLKYQIGPGNKN